MKHNRSTFSNSVQSNYFFLSIIAAIIAVCGCQPSSRNESYAHVPQENIEKGKILAEQQCQACHLLSDPSLLDAKTWAEGALPAMGPLLGIFNFRDKSYVYQGDPQMLGPGFLASYPKITQEEWGYIFDYFTAMAPEKLPDQERSEEIHMQLPLFQLAKTGVDYRNSHISFVKIRENSETPLVFSDGVTNQTHFLNSSLQQVDSVVTEGPIVNIHFINENEAIACNIGSIMPTNDPVGSAQNIKSDSDKWFADPVSLIKGLRRPLQLTPADFNHDQKTDYLLCEFGYMNGGVSWMENMGDGKFDKHVLTPFPGATVAYLLDYNKDGEEDIIALVAQGEEGILLFTNNGNGNFVAKQLLRFPAVYGSSYFELADFNGDGMLDILYTCGDNADYTLILKPYHGVYIYLNRGSDVFEKAYFYPIHGCTKAVARDFDKDGDLDLATIAHYTNFTTQPEQGFIYHENKGDLKFSQYTVKDLQIGRWITMDAGDIDDDGWIDIVLGNFVQASSFPNPNVRWEESPPILVLKNLGK